MWNNPPHINHTWTEEISYQRNDRKFSDFSLRPSSSSILYIHTYVYKHMLMLTHLSFDFSWSASSFNFLVITEHFSSHCYYIFLHYLARCVYLPIWKACQVLSGKVRLAHSMPSIWCECAPASHGVAMASMSCKDGEGQRDVVGSDKRQTVLGCRTASPMSPISHQRSGRKPPGPWGRRYRPFPSLFTFAFLWFMSLEVFSAYRIIKVEKDL